MGTITATLGATVFPAGTDGQEQGLGEMLEHQVATVAGAQCSPIEACWGWQGSGGTAASQQRPPTTAPACSKAGAAARQGPVLPSASPGLSQLVMPRAWSCLGLQARFG